MENAEIGRNPSVVSQGVARHGGRAGIPDDAADGFAVTGRRRLKGYAVNRAPRLQAVVTELLKCGWSRRLIADPADVHLAQQLIALHAARVRVRVRVRPGAPHPRARYLDERPA
ncbi:hypothetical protein GCM10010123_40400 [Pilimelia anulata]|uniref:Uncharacterized protein n=1 Tax=Pilimelia anulata TaxID=53371 RepID=A0A8J3FCL8_9ACTN|nr:hypothetical protein GCM10010123_40400 [Pilimelia anulata]